MTLEAVPVELWHIEHLGKSVLPEDEEDARRGFNCDYLTLMKAQYEQDGEGGFTILADREPVGYFGCSANGELFFGRSAKLVGPIAMLVVRKAKPYFEQLVARRDDVKCYVWGENRKMLRFLKWLGFWAFSPMLHRDGTENGYLMGKWVA